MTLRDPAPLAALTLAAAVALAAAVVLFAPSLAARLVTPATSAPAAETVFTLLVFGAMAVIGVVGGALTGASALVPGSRPLAMLAVGAFVGLFGVTVSAGYAALAGALQVGAATASSAPVLLWGAGVVLLQAGAEEIYFRGWLQPVLARAWGLPAAVVVAAVAFTLLHVVGGARAPLSIANLFLGGLLFGVLAGVARGITGAVAAHFAWNGAEQLVLGLDPNPGVGGFGSALNFDLVGAQGWGGSEDGLNASYAMTAVLLAMLIPAAMLARRRLAP